MVGVPRVSEMGVPGVRGVPGSEVEGVERVGGLEVQKELREVREGGWQTCDEVVCRAGPRKD